MNMQGDNARITHASEKLWKPIYQDARAGQKTTDDYAVPKNVFKLQGKFSGDYTFYRDLLLTATCANVLRYLQLCRHVILSSCNLRA